MTPTKPYRKQSIIDSFWVVTLINAQILCKTSKLGNKGVVPTMGGRRGVEKSPRVGEGAHLP